MTGAAPAGDTVDRAILPNALVIGVQKSSTSWVAARLNQHPDAFVVRGELHYFDHPENFEKGARWYGRHFESAHGYKIRCEKTGAYFWTECSGRPSEPRDKPERIHALLPGAKLIVVLRDPVARTISAWNHLVRSAVIRADQSIDTLFDPEQAELVAEHGILTRGLYAASLERFLEVFPREQILVLVQERDVVADPQSGMRKLCAFLDIQPDHSFSQLGKAENRFDGTHIGNRIAYGLPEGLARQVLRVDRRILSRLGFRKLAYPVVSDVVRARLVEYFMADCQRLGEMIGPLPETWLDGRLGQDT